MAHKCDGCRYKGEHQEMGFVPFGVCLKETNLLKAERTYKAECCPYIVNAYADGTAEELQKVFSDLTDTKSDDLQKAAETIQGLAQAMTDVLMPLLDEAMKVLKIVSDAILRCYPNRRVVWLAIHHPKERVRKKNRNRIIKWINQQYKREGGK